MNTIDPNNAPDQVQWPPWFKNWVLPYVEESLLWPIFFAVWIHFVMALGVMMAMTIRDQPLLGGAVLFVILSGTGRAIWFEWQVRGRPGMIAVLLILTWICGALTGYWGAAYNLI